MLKLPINEIINLYNNLTKINNSKILNIEICNQSDNPFIEDYIFLAFCLVKVKDDSCIIYLIDLNIITVLSNYYVNKPNIKHISSCNYKSICISCSPGMFIVPVKKFNHIINTDYFINILSSCRFITQISYQMYIERLLISYEFYSNLEHLFPNNLFKELYENVYVTNTINKIKVDINQHINNYPYKMIKEGIKDA